MARLAILTFAAVLRETTSMVLSRRQTLQRGSLAAVVPLLAPTPALASTKTDAEKVLEALGIESSFNPMPLAQQTNAPAATTSSMGLEHCGGDHVSP